MKQKVFFIFFLFAIIVIVVLALRSMSGKSAKQGELRVESQPSASVFLNDKHIGRTPVGKTSYKIDAGEYAIRIVPESSIKQLALWENKITISPNFLTYVNVTLSESELSSAADILWLEKITGKKVELSVMTTPDGAQVLVDNETKGLTPTLITDLTQGDHTLIISSQGFETRTIKTRFTGGYRLMASVKLALSSGSSMPTASPTPVLTGTIKPTPGVSRKPTPSISAKVTQTKSEETGTEPDKPYALIKETPTGFLRLRSEPSTSAQELAKLKPGETYTILDTKSSWYQIQYTASVSGWIAVQYAEKVE